MIDSEKSTILNLKYIISLRERETRRTRKYLRQRKLLYAPPCVLQYIYNNQSMKATYVHQ